MMQDSDNADMKSFVILPYPGPQISLQVQSELVGHSPLLPKIAHPKPLLACSPSELGDQDYRELRTIREVCYCQTETVGEEQRPRYQSQALSLRGPELQLCAFHFILCLSLPMPWASGFYNSNGNQPYHHTSPQWPLPMLLPCIGVQLTSHTRG